MKLKRFNTIDKNSINAAIKVLKKGKLSPFVGNWKNDKIVGSFYGGENVQKLENKIKNFLGKICYNSKFMDLWFDLCIRGT